MLARNVTFCIVARNDKTRLLKLLDLIQPHVGGLIVVDQTSTDGTQAALRERGVAWVARPVAFMADPDRNFAHDLAPTEWVLTFDPDERPTQAFLDDLPTLVDQEEVDVYLLQCQHWINGVLVSDTDRLPRLFRKGYLTYGARPHVFPEMRTRPGEFAPRCEILDPSRYAFLHCRTMDGAVAANAVRNVYGAETEAVQRNFLNAAWAKVQAHEGPVNDYAIAVAKGEA